MCRDDFMCMVAVGIVGMSRCLVSCAEFEQQVWKLYNICECVDTLDMSSRSKYNANFQERIAYLTIHKEYRALIIMRPLYCNIADILEA